MRVQARLQKVLSTLLSHGVLLYYDRNIDPLPDNARPDNARLKLNLHYQRSEQDEMSFNDMHYEAIITYYVKMAY